MSDLISFNNPVFTRFALHGTIVVVKMAGLSLLTSYYRVSKNVYANEEDLSLGGEKTITDDADVERVRRNHLNDVENIFPYVLVGGLYVLTKPDPTTAMWHFRAFTMARFAHTLVYQFAVPQPSRALMHFVSLGVTMSMACRVMCVAWHAL